MVFALLIFYSMSAIALIKLRRKEEGNPDAYHLPLYPFIPALYLTFALAMLILRLIFEWKNSLLDLAFIATGLPFSLIWVFRKKNSGTPLSS
jgi:APA family basic amino acid/polyamine antiporter